MKNMPYFLGETSNNDFFNDFKKRYEDFNNKLNEINNDNSSNTDNELVVEVNSLIDSYDECMELMQEIESKIRNHNKEYSNYNYNNYSDGELISLKLINLKDKENVIIKKVPAKRKYLYFKDYNNLDEASEIKAQDLEKNDYVILLDKTKESFMEIFMEIFNFEDTINMELATYWKDKMYSYAEIKELSVEEFHRLYCDAGGKIKLQSFKKWLKGDNISPRSLKDLDYLANVMDDSYLRNHKFAMKKEFTKIRGLHILMGRSLKALIKSIITGDNTLLIKKLSFEEQILYKLIKTVFIKLKKSSKYLY